MTDYVTCFKIKHLFCFASSIKQDTIYVGIQDNLLTLKNTPQNRQPSLPGIKCEH